MGFIVDLGRYVGGLLVLSLAALFSGVALIPPYLLFTLVDERYGRLFAVASAPFGYVLWGFGLCFLIVAYKRLTFYKLREGTFHIYTYPIIQWAITGYLSLFAHAVFVQFLKGTPFINWWYRGLGAKIGRRVTIQTTFVSDWDLITLGDDTTLGGESAVIAHVFEMGQIKLMPVTLGKSVTIGRATTVFPGVTIGDRAVVGGHSLVTKGKQIPADTIWAGAPAVFVRERTKKDEAKDDPLAKAPSSEKRAQVSSSEARVESVDA